MSTSFSRNLGS